MLCTSHSQCIFISRSEENPKYSRCIRILIEKWLAVVFKFMNVLFTESSASLIIQLFFELQLHLILFLMLYLKSFSSRSLMLLNSRSQGKHQLKSTFEEVTFHGKFFYSRNIFFLRSKFSPVALLLLIQMLFPSYSSSFLKCSSDFLQKHIVEVKFRINFKMLPSSFFSSTQSTDPHPFLRACGPVFHPISPPGFLCFYRVKFVSCF